MSDDAPPPEPTRKVRTEPTRKVTPEPTRVSPPPTEVHGGGAAPEPAEEGEFVGLQIDETRLVRPIGEGGMGVIYEGWQEPPGRTVAVKLLRQAVASAEARYRFQHEARVLASLRHPAVAQVHSVGTHGVRQELPYILMEYVPEARTLADYVRDQALGLDETLALFSRVCRGVQAGHARGVIHRDLKPANILVDPDGNPKIIDFGIARVAAEEETAATPKTTTGEVVGTVYYMSPEQFTGHREDVDVRSDVYALGVVLYETLTGELPFDFEDLGILEVIKMVQAKAPRTPESVRPDLAGDVSVIIGKALAKEPERRYASAEALADDIDRYLERRPILARPPSLRYQIRMYAKRRKATFAAFLGVAASIVVALVAVSIYARSEAKARAKAEREEAKARTLLHESARFVPTLAGDLENRLAKVVGATEARRVLAENLETLATRLAAVDGAAEDAEVANALGAAELAVANIRSGIGGGNYGDGSASLDRYGRAVSHFERAHERMPDDPRFRSALISATLTLANQNRMMGRFDATRDALAKAQALLTVWEAEGSNHDTLPALRFEYARGFGHLMWDQQEPEDALEAYRQAHERIVTFAWPEGAADLRTSLLLESHLNLAEALVRLERKEDAKPHIQKLVALSSTLDTSRSNAKTRGNLWHVHMKLANFENMERRHEAARDHYRKALTLAREAAVDDAHDAGARMRVRLSRGELGAVLEMLQDFEGAREHHAASLVAVREERQRDPGNEVLAWDLRVALARLAAVEGQLGNYEASERLLTEAREIQRARAQAYPDRIDEVAGVSDVEYAAAAVALARAEKAETLAENIDAYETAARHLKAAVKVLEPLEKQGKLRPSDTSNMGHWRGAIQALEEALTKLRAMR